MAEAPDNSYPQPAPTPHQSSLITDLDDSSEWDSPPELLNDDDVIAGLYPLDLEEDSDEEMRERFRAFQLNFREHNRRSRQRNWRRLDARRWDAVIDWGLRRLFGDVQTTSSDELSDSSESGSSSSHHSIQELPEAVYYDDQDVELRRTPVRSLLGQGLQIAKLEVRKLLLIATLETKVDNPNRPYDAAWDALVVRLRNEGVYPNESALVVAWKFAFGDPALHQFRTVYESPIPVIQAHWRDAEQY